MNRLTILAMATALALCGCSTATLAPKELPKNSPSNEKAVLDHLRTDESWNQVPILTEGKSAVVLLTPESLPASIKDMRLSLELDPGTTISDVTAILGHIGVPIILADQEIARKDFYMPKYNGTVGGFLSALTKATDVWFTWHESSIVASGKERIGVSVPQESSFSETLGKGLEALGVKDKAVTWQAGMVVLDVAPSQFRKVRTYLERYTANAAVVTLQMAVINVSLNQTAKSGIDWANLQLSALPTGTTAGLKAWQNYNNQSNSVISNSLSSGVSNAVTNGVQNGISNTVNTALPKAPSSGVTAVGIVAGALTGAIFNEAFSFSGLFNFLQTYGNAETKQNVMLKTIAGNKVEFKSVTSVPYVSEVGVTTSTTNANTTGSTKTEKADDGITVEMTPTFDSAANSVTVDLKLSIKAVLGFNELSAGNQVGKLTQPTTAERSFTDTLRLRPGQTVVIGGLTYDTYSNNRSSPLLLADTRAESQSLAVARQTMFIVVRPTVLKLGQVLAQEAGTELAMFPAGVVPAEPDDKGANAKPAKPKTQTATE